MTCGIWCNAINADLKYGCYKLEYFIILMLLLNNQCRTMSSEIHKTSSTKWVQILNSDNKAQGVALLLHFLKETFYNMYKNRLVLNYEESCANSIEGFMSHFNPMISIIADKKYLLQDHDLHNQIHINNQQNKGKPKIH